MHPNKTFRAASREQNLAFVRDRSFGVLTLSDASGPLAAHVPFVLSSDGQSFGCHLVRSNPIIPLLSEDPVPALMIVSGPDGYVSPDWYDLDDQVPTWNYVAVHLRGTLTRLPPSELRSHLSALSAQFEEHLAPKPQWTLDKVSPEALARLENMIIPVSFRIEDVDGTWKLSQNKPDPARMNAADGMLGGSPGQMVSELAALMKDV